MSVREQLARAQATAVRTDDDERRILAHAEQMLEACNAEIAAVEARAKAGDAEAEAAYQHHVLERGKLNIIIARAREALA